MKINYAWYTIIALFITNSSYTQIISKCFSNEGLKYVTIIKIKIYPDHKVTGTVSSSEYEQEELPENEVSFSGAKSGNLLNIKFHKEPPIVGTASSWTNKSWVIRKVGKDEVLVIPFTTKSYETNKWGMTTYDFMTCVQ